MDKGINVLSLFDGISCGQIALERAGIKVNKYYASEIDQHAIKVTQHNWPDTIQLGDVTEVKSEDLPKIDLLIGGSPCQGFSFAGKQLNFEDPRSKLFFEYTRLLRECKPSFFLLENVKMKKESEKVISEYLGVEPIEINSALVSAQNRRRLYWTNIPDVKQPEDKGITFQSILENGYTNREKSFCITCASSWLKRENLSIEKAKYRNKKQFLPVVFKSSSLKFEDGWRCLTINEIEKLQTLNENYTNVVKPSQRYKAIGNGWTVDVIAHIFKSLSKELAE